MAIVSAIIDSREPDWVQRLTFGGIPTAVTMLDAGDLMLATDKGELLLVERKTASDFLGTMNSDRLEPQLTKMREIAQWSYLAICGTLTPGPQGRCYENSRETNQNWASVAGMLLTVQEIGVSIIFTAGDHDFEAAMMRIANRDRRPLRVKPARAAAFVSDGEAILSALPGIGPERAQALMEYCNGSAAWALRYLTELNWRGPTCPGIADGTRRRIRKALALEDWAILGVLHPDDEKELEVKREKSA